MENASKALLMAATVLIGVLLISLGVYLFTVFGDFGAETTAKLAQKDIDEFNAQFYKYESYQDENGNWKNTCRAQDIVTIANLAKENNAKYEYTTREDKDTGSYYISVTVITKSNGTIDNFENDNLTKEYYQNFMKDYSGNSDSNSEYKIINFICTDVTIDENTKKVNSITFEEL